MRFKVKAMIIPAVVVLAAMSVMAADEQPKLHPDVALEIRNAQVQLQDLALQGKDMEIRYTQLQAQISAGNIKLQGLLSNALDKSNVDKTKWQLDPITLNITAIPVTPPAPAPNKPAAKPPKS